MRLPSKLPKNLPRVKIGQLWKHRKTEQVVTITKRQKNDYWATAKIRVWPENKRTKNHGIYEKDLYLYWDLL